MPQADAARLSTLIVELRRLQHHPRSGKAGTALPMSQKEVLRQVAAHPGTGTSAIARALRLAPNTVSGIVSALIQDGYLRREVDERDRRATRLHLTERAHERRAARWERRADITETALSHLSDEQRRSIGDALPALEALRDEMRNMQPAADPSQDL